MAGNLKVQSKPKIFAETGSAFDATDFARIKVLLVNIILADSDMFSICDLVQYRKELAVTREFLQNLLMSRRFRLVKVLENLLLPISSKNIPV